MNQELECGNLAFNTDLEHRRADTDGSGTLDPVEWGVAYTKALPESTEEE